MAEKLETGGVGSSAKAVSVRPVAPGEERVLWEVFRSSVHGIARLHYSPAQLDAWAPAEYPGEAWAERIRGNAPLVAELHGVVVGFADVQANGHIDQFFVSPAGAGRGVGRRLMAELEARARAAGATGMSADVSLSAEAFFARHGFEVEQRQEVVVNGVVFRNARMTRSL